MNTILRIGLLAMLILTVVGAAPLFADEHDAENDYGEDGRNWELMSFSPLEGCFFSIVSNTVCSNEFSRFFTLKLLLQPE